ncbi:unnamed protein product [Caenorhabditis sp. 36 PRJEB53466]|nr:unnamed protein product [Caenorhabditis sp. 36 PRJEB53466]
MGDHRKELLRLLRESLQRDEEMKLELSVLTKGKKSAEKKQNVVVPLNRDLHELIGALTECMKNSISAINRVRENGMYVATEEKSDVDQSDAISKMSP